MAEVTYFVALPFRQTDDGDLMAGDAVECPNAGRAVKEAQRMSRTNTGAVAFSRSGDPASGEFADAKIIKQFGELPLDMFAVADDEDGSDDAEASEAMPISREDFP